MKGFIGHNFAGMVFRGSTVECDVYRVEVIFNIFFLYHGLTYVGCDKKSGLFWQLNVLNTLLNGKLSARRVYYNIYYFLMINEQAYRERYLTLACIVDIQLYRKGTIKLYADLHMILVLRC